MWTAVCAAVDQRVSSASSSSSVIGASKFSEKTLPFGDFFEQRYLGNLDTFNFSFNFANKLDFIMNSSALPFLFNNSVDGAFLPPLTTNEGLIAIDSLKDEDFAEVSTVNSDYLQVYEFEKNFELTPARKLIGRWWWISILSSAVYLLLIFSGERLMKNREPFKIRKLLTLWNILLAAFSIFGFLRTLPELYYVFSQSNGFYKSVCIRDDHNAATAFWGFAMTLSKLVELGDTAFIVLKKQPLIFLHWYHHCTVLIFTFATYEQYDPPLRWFMTMNMFVHALMYTYYCLKSLRIYIPKVCSIFLTSLQLSQMVVGVTINIYAIYVKSVVGAPCACSKNSITYSLTMYASYAVLFSLFFKNAYLTKRKLA